MSETRPLTDHNFGSELDNVNNCFSDNQLVGNSAFIKALEVVVLRNIPRLLIPIFETSVRRIVKEEIELAQQRFSTSTNQNSDERAISPQLRKLKLRFRNKLHLPILTGKPILGENNSTLELELIDENTGLLVKFGPESSASVEIVVHRLDQNIMGEGENAKSLTGNRYLNLREGTGSVENIFFTHGKNWTRKGDFMLGARFLNNYDGIIVTEAKSEQFTLQDCRNKLYVKHDSPVLTDKVWRLKNIRKGGIFDKRLNGEKIKTVKDFLIQYFLNRQKLQNVLKMSDKVFTATVQHGLTCKRDKHMYRPPNTQGNTCVVFDTVGQLLGVLFNNDFVSVDKLSEYAKDDAQKSVVSAFENWGDVVGYYETETSLPSTSSNIFLPNYPLYSPTIDIPSPYLCSLQHSASPQSIGVHDGLHPIICPSIVTMPPNNAFTDGTTTTTSMVDLDCLDAIQPADLELLREYLNSPLHVPEFVDEDFCNEQMFDFTTMVEDFNKDRAWVRRWLKMVLVVRFFLRMRRMEKTDHVPKRIRI